MPPAPPELFVHWERFVRDLFPRTAAFPRRVRLSVTVRIESLALDIYERIIEARYGHARAAALRQARLDLEKLRLLLRVAHDQRFLDGKAFARCCEQIEEASRMTQGWLRHAEAQA